MQNTNGKTALLIGASSGIGFETAKLLLEKGYSVYNASRSEAPHPMICNIMLDVVNTEQIQTATELVFQAEGKIDLLLYSAGFSMAAPLEHTNEVDMHYLFDVNFFGFVHCLQNVIPRMRQQGFGRIIAISSIGGIVPIAYDPLYSASKSALNMLIKELAIELRPWNIDITAIMPGGTATPFTKNRKIYHAEQTGDYAPEVQKAAESLAEIEQGGMPPEKVAETIVHIAEMKNPPVIEASGFLNKGISVLQKLMPEALVQEMVKTQYHL